MRPIIIIVITNNSLLLNFPKSVMTTKIFKINWHLGASKRGRKWQLKPSLTGLIFVLTVDCQVIHFPHPESDCTVLSPDHNTTHYMTFQKMSTILKTDDPCSIQKTTLRTKLQSLSIHFVDFLLSMIDRNCKISKFIPRMKDSTSVTSKKRRMISPLHCWTYLT